MAGIGLILSFLFVNPLSAQDIQYSQFYANPMYLNPAFTGSSENSRMGVSYRNQWPGINQSISSFSSSYDTYLPTINSGIGIIFNKSQQSHTHLSVSEFGAVYSYGAKIGSNSFLRLGGQVSYVDRDAYFGNLIFGSQIDNFGNISNFSGENLGLDFRHQFFNYSAGLLYNNSKIWLGISAHHLGQPNLSYLDGQISQLPVKISTHGGIKFDLLGISTDYDSKRELVLAFHYKNQEPFQQLDLGAQFNIQPLVVGLWYRGMPLKGTESLANESLIGLVGISLGGGLDIGYSYDYNISSLGNAQSAGAHEISIRYSFRSAFSKGYELKSSMPCFKY